MEVSYKHEVTHSFLVIQPEKEVDMKAYPLRMILGNVIPGLLSCKLQKADGKVFFYYDVTARQQLSTAYQTLTYEELRILYQGVLKIFEQMDRYLLDSNQLLIDPEYVYLDRKEGDLYLCYLPGYEKSAQEQLRCFTEYLLPLLDHQDSRGVLLGYGVYRLLVEKNFQMEAVGEIIHKAEIQGNSGAEMSAGVQEAGEQFKNIKENMTVNVDGSRRTIRELGIKAGKKETILFLVSLFLLMGFLILRRMGYFSGVTLPVMLAVLFCGILVVALTAQGKKRKRQEKDLEKTLDISKEEYDSPVLVCEEMEQVPPIILDQDMIVIGKGNEEADVLLNSSSISHIHARIQKKNEGYWIADLDSQNEIFINGKRLESGEEYLLQPEDRVVFMDMCYRFIETE